MKNNFLYVFALFLLSAKLTGQTTTDTLFVYETIVVYDTIKVYDTLKVEYKKELNSNASETFLKNNNSAKNAVLVLDTATQKAQLVLFSKNDTATISISNIILSETNKNLDTMKKEILTLAATALLAQLTFAQVAEEIKTVTKHVPQKYALSIGATYSIPRQIGYGGNFKLDYLKSDKLSFGLKTNLMTCSYRAKAFYSEKYAPGLYLISDLTLTYYLIGNNHDSKFGMYAELGVGYQYQKVSSTRQFYGEPTVYKHTFTASGFGGHASLGANYKLGKGKIYFELIAGQVLYGKETSDGQQYLDISEAYKKQGSFIGDRFIGINLGYAFNF